MTTTTMLRELAADVVEQIREAEDRYDVNQLKHEVCRQLIDRAEGNQDLMLDIFRRAADAAVDYVERAESAERRRRDQLTFFEPDRFVVLGDRERARMSVLTYEDALRRQSVIAKNIQSQQEAYHLENGYWLERALVWKDMPDRQLGEVERAHFGWEANEAA